MSPGDHNRRVWLEKKVEFHRATSMEMAQRVPRRSSGNAPCFNCLLEMHVVHWYITISESPMINGLTLYKSIVHHTYCTTEPFF